MAEQCLKVLSSILIQYPFLSESADISLLFGVCEGKKKSAAGTKLWLWKQGRKESDSDRVTQHSSSQTQDGEGGKRCGGVVLSVTALAMHVYEFNWAELPEKH